jgi:hypothetical protein
MTHARSRRKQCAYWFCHVERVFRPYPARVNAAIERQYREQGTGRSGEFLLKGTRYYVDFQSMLQVCASDPGRYRGVRRITTQTALGAKAYSKLRIPLTFAELLAIGAHYENYLTGEEMAARKVKGEGAPGFLPDVLTRVGAVWDSSYDPIASAMAANPGLTREEAQEMAEALGFG